MPAAVELARGARVTWNNRDGRTVGRIGEVCIRLAGGAWIPPGLPNLAGFAPGDGGSVAFVYASPQDLEADKPAARIKVEIPRAHGHGVELGQRFAVVHTEDGKPGVYTSMEDALEASLLALELRGAKLT